MTSRHIKLPQRFVLTDHARGPDPFEQLAQLTMNDALTLRHYELVKGDRLILARDLRRASRAKGVRLLIAGDDKLALHVGADGLHLPSWMTRAGWRRAQQTQNGWIVTAAAHCESELRAAEIAGADAALLSPVFPTVSHPGAATLGIVRFAALAVTSTVPVYALGGVTPQSFRQMASVPNLAGCATVSGF